MQDIISTLDLTSRMLARIEEVQIALRRGQPARLQRALQQLEFTVYLERGNALNTLEAFEAMQATYRPQPAAATDDAMMDDRDEAYDYRISYIASAA